MDGRRWVSASAAIAATVGLAATVASVGCGSKLEKVADSEVDGAQKAQAQAIATKIYQGCREGHFEALGSEATDEMRAALTPDRLKSTCESITASFGNYQSMEYVETWKQGSTFRIYRFKGQFDKAPSPPEIRVVMDGSSKLSGFWLRPWAETLN